MRDIIEVVDYFTYEYSGNENPRRDRFDSGQNMLVVCVLILLVENGLDIKKKYRDLVKSFLLIVLGWFLFPTLHFVALDLPLLSIFLVQISQNFYPF